MDDLGVPPCLIGLPHQVFAADARSPGVRDPPATNCNELLAGKTGVFCRGLTNMLVLDGTFMIFHGICEDDEDDVWICFFFR